MRGGVDGEVVGAAVGGGSVVGGAGTTSAVVGAAVAPSVVAAVAVDVVTSESGAAFPAACVCAEPLHAAAPMTVSASAHVRANRLTTVSPSTERRSR